MGDKDFFLSPDDAQTMGDINYMRKSVRVRRTFPKTLKNKDGFAIEKSVSAQDVQDDSSFKGQGAFNVESKDNSRANYPTGLTARAEESQAGQPDSTTSAEPTTKAEQRRQTDTNLDMFRNMARNLRRK